MNSFRYPLRGLIKIALIGAVVSAHAGVSFAQQSFPDGALEEEAPVQALPKGASLEGAREKVSNYSSEAGKSLEKLMGDAVTSRTAAEVGALAERKRNIMLLQLQREEAKLAKELYFELAGPENENEDVINKLREENDALKSSLENIQSSPRTASNAITVSPVVTDITGAAGGVKATISYPGSGNILASPGVVLPNGWKVVSVSSSGVTVDDGGVRKNLGFGPSFQ